MPDEWTRQQAEEVARMGRENLTRWLHGGLMSWSGSRVTAFTGTSVKFDPTGEVEPQLAALIKALGRRRDREYVWAAVRQGFQGAARTEIRYGLFRSLQKIVQLVGDHDPPVTAMVERLVDDETFLRSFDRVKANELYRTAFDVLEATGYTIRTPELVEKLQASPYYGFCYAEHADRILRARAA